METCSGGMGGMPVGCALAVLGLGTVRHAGRAVVLQGKRLLQRMKSLQGRKFRKLWGGSPPFLHIFNHFHSSHRGY